MNKTIDVNLGGLIFHLDEEAYRILTQYLSRIKSYLRGTEGSDEIISDIENRIAELFAEKLQNNKQVINERDVHEVVQILGQPEDYQLDPDDDSEKTYANTSEKDYSFKQKRKFFRDPDEKIIGGVSGGLAAYFDIDVVWLRLLFIVLTVAGGPGLIIYIILWAIIPEAVTTAQKLQMRGEPVNFSTIERKIKEEFDNVKTRVENFAESDNLKNTSSSIARTAQRFFEFIFNLLEQILTFIVKFFGVILMIGAAIVLFIVISVSFSGNITVNNSVIDFYDIAPFLDYIVLQPFQIQMLYIAIGLIIIAPIVGLLFLGARILFGYHLKNKIVKSAFILLPVLGFFILIWTSLSIGKEFREQGSFTEEKNLDFAPNNFIYLDVNKHPAFVDFDLPIHHQNNKMYLEMVKLNISKTSRPEPVLEIKALSRGGDLVEAREHAKANEYFFEKQDSLLLLDDFFQLDAANKYRGQRLIVTLYLPVGHGVFFADNTLKLLDDVEKASKFRNSDMIGNQFIMTQNGLFCASCPNNEVPSDIETDRDNDRKNIQEEIEEELRTLEEEIEKEREQAKKELERELEALKEKLNNL